MQSKNVSDVTHILSPQSEESEYAVPASLAVGDITKKNQQYSTHGYDKFDENVGTNYSCKSRCENFESTTLGLDDSFLDEADFRTIDYLVSNVSYKLGKDYHDSLKNHASQSSRLKNPNKRPRVFTEVAKAEHDKVNSCVKPMFAHCAEEQHQVTSELRQVLMANAHKSANFTSISRTSEIPMSYHINDPGDHETSATSDFLNSSTENMANNEQTDTFYGLPPTVQQLVHDFKGIETLYGNNIKYNNGYANHTLFSVISVYCTLHLHYIW